LFIIKVNGDRFYKLIGFAFSAESFTIYQEFSKIENTILTRGRDIYG